MAMNVVMPWFNPYASISPTSGFVESAGSATTVVGQIVSDGAGTPGATVGIRKTYSTLADIAADTSTGTSHSGCPIIPCASADTLVFRFMGFQSILNGASENYAGDGVSTITHLQRFTVWGVRPQYANGVDDGPYVVEPVITYRLTQTSVAGIFNQVAPAYAGSVAAPGDFFPLLNTTSIIGTSTGWSWINLVTSSYGTSTSTSIDVLAGPYAKSAGLITSSGTMASFTGTAAAFNDSRCLNLHAVVGLHRYSHFMLATQFVANSGTTGKFNRIAALCLGLSTTMG